MALSASTVWEVRPAGGGASDLNGGGFVTGASGTDYSQQDAAAFSGTNLTVDATTNTKVTSAVHNFVAADVGNLIQITAGTGWTLGFYQVVSVASNAATLDRSPAATGTTGGTWALGGALASPGKVAGALVAGNDVWVKAGTYTISNTTPNTGGGPVNLTVGGVDDSNVMRWVGYSTTRGDLAARPVFQAASSGVTSIALFQIAAQRIYLDNLELDGQSKTSIRGWFSTAEYVFLGVRLVARNCTLIGFGLNSGATLVACRGTGCSAASAAFVLAGRSTAYFCVADANTVWGFEGIGAEMTFNYCLAYNNTQDGFYCNSYTISLLNCTSYGNGGNGFTLVPGSLYNTTLLNCLASNNGGYGFRASSSVDAALLWNCAGYSNTSGNVSNLPNSTGFVTLTANPFVAPGSGNLALNTTAGGGAACRVAGVPGAFPGGLTTSYLDIGAAQHADSPGGGNWIGFA